MENKSRYEKELSSHRNNNFDFLRLSAAIGVAVDHCFVTLGQGASELSYKLAGIKIGEICIDILFLISGYLVLNSYKNSPAHFIKKRFLRIFPGLAVNIIFTIFIIGLLFTSLPLDKYLTSSGTYLYLANTFPPLFYLSLPGVFDQNSALNGSLWSLGSEVILYYLLWLIGSLKLGFKLVIPALIIISIIFVIKGDEGFMWEVKGILITLQPYHKLALFFFTGSLFYLQQKHITYSLKTIFAVSMISAILAFSKFYFAAMYIFLPYSVFFLAFNKSINLSKAAVFGDFSYGVYIYSSPIEKSVIAYFKLNSPLTLFLYSFPITLILALLSWHLVEKPMLKFKPVKSSP